MSDQEIETFKRLIKQFYQDNRRSFPWRETPSPYNVFISEIMLQQTQTYRVEPKYLAFVDVFPDFQSLANATLEEVLRLWQGLGYNRRAKFLHQAAQMIMDQFGGELPADPDQLEQLPGVGSATAASLSTFAYNRPTLFIETNIRTVFIHHFFSDQDEIHDKEILPLVERTLDHDNPRDWYYALMDYGVMLKATQPNPSRRSKHHVKQSRFEGSNRQLRGQILKLLLEQPQSDVYLCKHLEYDASKVQYNLERLKKEGLVREAHGVYFVA